MIISFIYYMAISKFVDSSFPQCNVYTGVQGGCLAFTPFGWLSQPIRIHWIYHNENEVMCSRGVRG